MAAFAATLNQKPAEAMIPGGLNLVLTTTSQPLWKKDRDDELVHDQVAHV